MTDKTTTEADESADLKATIESLKESVAKLEKKNSDLIAAQKKAKQEADAAEDAKNLASNDLETIKATLEKQIKTLTAERDQNAQHLNTLLVDNAITKALVDHKVVAHMHEPLAAMFRMKASVKDGKAFHEDMELDSFLTDYFKGDRGKHFIAEPMNTGTGATGSEVAGSEWSAPPVTGQEMQKWSAWAVGNPTQAASLAQAWNRPELMP